MVMYFTSFLQNKELLLFLKKNAFSARRLREHKMKKILFLKIVLSRIPVLCCDTLLEGPPIMRELIQGVRVQAHLSRKHSWLCCMLGAFICHQQRGRVWENKGQRRLDIRQQTIESCRKQRLGCLTIDGI